MGSNGGAFIGSSLGYGITVKTTNYFNGKLNPWSNGLKERPLLEYLFITAPPVISSIPSIVGSTIGAIGAESANKIIIDKLNSEDNE